MKKNKLFCAAISLCLALSLIIPLTSCVYSDEIIPCYDIVSSLTEIEIGLPAGKIYSSSAKEGEEEYLPDTLLASLLGDGKQLPLFDSWIDCALFLPSSNHPCQIIAILCDTPTSAKDTARLLSRRLNALRSAYKASNGGGISRPSAENGAAVDTAAYLDNATVMINRNYVLLIISSDTATLRKKAFAMTGSLVTIRQASNAE